jgi:hypothetical protein
VIVEQQTWAFDIRDAFYNVVTPDSFFSSYTKRKTKMLQVQPDQLPYLGIYIVDESMVPDGDANVGMIRFCHTTRIGFSVIDANNDPDVAEKQVDAAYQRLMVLLWTDLKLMNVLQTLNPEGVLIESITRGTRRHVFGNTGLNNETPFVELQYEVSAFYRTEWWPDITDDLQEIDVTTGIKIGETQDERDQRQQVNVKYTFMVPLKEVENGTGSAKNASRRAASVAGRTTSNETSGSAGLPEERRD